MPSFASLACSKSIAPLALAAAGALALSASPALADDRRFTFVYETTTMAPGQVEYEQWVTFKGFKDSDSSFRSYEFRHEVEFGVTENFQLAFYLADWRYRDGKSVADGVEFQTSAVEAVYALLNPNVDPIGLALYGEYKGGPDKHVLEAKLLLQKNLDGWVFAHNSIIEAEWEDEDGQWEEKGVFGQSAGVSYQFHPSFTMGAELLHEIELSHWEDFGDHVVYIGPNASYRATGWWVTVTPMFQVTSVEDEPNFMTRFLFGIHF